MDKLKNKLSDFDFRKLGTLGMSPRSEKLRKETIEKFEDGNVLNKDKVKAVRDWLGSDHVLRDAHHFIFCETIQDVDYEEIN